MFESMAESFHQGMAQWIQYKLGKQYFGNKKYTTLGIEPSTFSYPGRFSYPIIVSVGLKTCGHSPLNPSKVGFPCKILGSAEKIPSGKVFLPSVYHSA